METLKVDTLNVIDIMSMTDEETDREIRHIDINQEIVIPNMEPLSLFSDDDDEQDVDSEGNKKTNKLHRQRRSLNQTKAKDSDILLMETFDQSSLSPPPFSPPPLPLSPNTNIITTSFNREVGFLSLPLTTTTLDPVPSEHQRKHRHKHHQRHRHSMAVGRTAPIDERSHQHHSSQHHHNHHHQHHHHQHQQQQQQPPETEIVLSPSKLGQ